MLNFLRSDRTLDHPERLGAYVHSVCINVMMEMLRASTRHPTLPDAAQNLADGRVSPEQEVVTRERRDLVREVLAELPEKDQQILRSIFLEETDKSEVCERFHVNRDYLRVLVHRAKLRFKAALDRNNAKELKRTAGSEH